VLLQEVQEHAETSIETSLGGVLGRFRNRDPIVPIFDVHAEGMAHVSALAGSGDS
jgi:hypothetical protein